MTDTWTIGPNLPSRREGPASVPFGDRFLLIGGTDFDAPEGQKELDSIVELDPVNMVWLERPEKIKIPRGELAATWIHDDGKIC